MQMIKTGLILFGHGARDPEWSRPIERLFNILVSQYPEQVVAVAFLEYLSPTLENCVSPLIAKGMRDFVVLPIFIAQGGHLKRELPEMLLRLAEQYPDCHFNLAPAMGESESVIAAMAAHAASHFCP